MRFSPGILLSLAHWPGGKGETGTRRRRAGAAGAAGAAPSILSGDRLGDDWGSYILGNPHDDLILCLMKAWK